MNRNYDDSCDCLVIHTVWWSLISCLSSSSVSPSVLEESRASLHDFKVCISYHPETTQPSASYIACVFTFIKAAPLWTGLCPVCLLRCLYHDLLLLPFPVLPQSMSHWYHDSYEVVAGSDLERLATRVMWDEEMHLVFNGSAPKQLDVI